MAGRAPGLAFYLGASSDHGRWWVRGGKLCQKWRVWFSKKTRCFRVRKKGRTIHWVDNAGKSGTAHIAYHRPIVRKNKTTVSKVSKSKVAQAVIQAKTARVETSQPKLVHAPVIVASRDAVQSRLGFANSDHVAVQPPHPNPIRTASINTSQFEGTVPTPQRVRLMPPVPVKARSQYEALKKKKNVYSSNEITLSSGKPLKRQSSRRASIASAEPGNTPLVLAKKYDTSVKDVIRRSGITTTFLTTAQEIEIPQLKKKSRNRLGRSVKVKTRYQKKTRYLFWNGGSQENKAFRRWLKAANRKAEAIWNDINTRRR